MPKYKNPRIQEELDLAEQENQHVEVMKETPKNEEDEVWKKRYGDLRSHAQKESDRKEAEILALKKQLDGVKSGKIRPPKTEAELKEWEDEYPDFAAVMDARTDRRIDAKMGDIRIQTEEIKKEKALQALAKRHPDYTQVFSDENFHEWLKTKSKTFQNTIYKSFNVDDAADILDAWKLKSKKKVKDEDTQDDPREAAKAVRVKSKNAFSEDADNDYDFSESQIERESNRDPRWWGQNEKKIDEARRKGRILYDLSGGAR